MKGVSVLVPAYNEEKSIGKCIQSCLNQTEKPFEIIVVNDGSTDNTLEILKSFGKQIRVIDIKKNTGNKSKAQEIGLKYVRTDVFVTTDADTRLDENFVKQIKKSFEDKSISAVCGYVKSDRNNWLTKVRDINYIIGQTISKKAQGYINALFVIVGCSSAFRTKDFRETIKFDHDNITEDLDFTYQLKLSNKKIDFNDNAIAFTQDPNTIKSYLKQIYRWYSGGWACLRKNFRIIKQPNNALILSTVYLEGLLMGGLFLLFPLILFVNFKYLIYILSVEFFLTSACLTYGAFKQKRYYLFFYIPHHYAMHIVDNMVFLFTFVKEMIFNKRNLSWNKFERY